jgi:large subunit ribosomal protein L25
MKTVTIEGQLRSELGKKHARAIRSEDQVPGVIYGGASTVNFTTSLRTLKPLVYTPDFQIAEVKIDGKTYKCIVKDLQFHKVTDALLHIDLLELVDSKPLLATIPLKFVGTSIGVKNGGRLVIKSKDVKVKCLPKHLVESIPVAIDDLEIGRNLRIADVKSEGITIMQNERIPIASVVTTRALKQAEADAAKEATGAKK